MLSVLIIDDDVGDRKIVSRALKKSGLTCNVTEAEDVETALKLSDSTAFDCAIIDYRMPKMDGLDGIHAVREKIPGAALIMTTGQGSESIASEAIKRGASDYLPKRELTPESILRIINGAMEKRLLQTKLHEQELALKLFARTLAHDLKAPIRHICYFCERMQEEVSKGDLNETIELTHRMDATSKQMKELIDTLSEYNHAGDEGIPFGQLSLSQVLDEVIENLEMTIEKHQAEITRTSLPDVYGNAPQLRQLLQNLIANAIKFCDEKRPKIHIKAEALGDTILITVKDNGIGIPEDKLSDIFAPFKRVHSSKKYKGTGLGLATCQKIVQRHGGKIWCTSKPCEGSSFHIQLSACARPQKTGHADGLAN